MFMFLIGSSLVHLKTEKPDMTSHNGEWADPGQVNK